MSRSFVPVALVLALAVGCGSVHRDPGTPIRAVGPSPVVDPVPVPLRSGPAPRYRPPVAAPVVDPFRPPPGPFAAGNRGLEYETPSGAAVGAIGAGRVVFAGPVAGSLHVTVVHGDGLRSSYSYLATLAVTRGEAVGAGQAVGTADGRLHLGVRAGDAYLDPALLFDRGAVHLVPLDEAPTGPAHGS